MARQRHAVSRDERVKARATSITELRAQLHAADQRLIAAARDLHLERVDRIEWQRLAAERAVRIVALEHQLTAHKTQG